MKNGFRVVKNTLWSFVSGVYRSDVLSGTFLKSSKDLFVNWLDDFVVTAGSVCADSGRLRVWLLHTGDVAATGGLDDTNEASIFCKDMIARLESLSPSFVLQLGNHDVYDWDAFPCISGLGDETLVSSRTKEKPYPIQRCEIEGIKFAFVTLDFVLKVARSRGFDYGNKIRQSLKGENTRHLLEELERLLRALRAEDCLIIASTHFPIGRVHSSGGLSMNPPMLSELQQILESHEVALVLEGHVHSSHYNVRHKTHYFTAPTLSSTDLATSEGTGFNEIIVCRHSPTEVKLDLRTHYFRPELVAGVETVLVDSIIHLLPGSR